MPTTPHTTESLARAVAKLRTREDTAYRIAKRSGLTINAVNRFFQGYKHTTEYERVPNPDELGRVKLGTFLQIVQAMGYDVEIVEREAS